MGENEAGEDRDGGRSSHESENSKAGLCGVDSLDDLEEEGEVVEHEIVSSGNGDVEEEL